MHIQCTCMLFIDQSRRFFLPLKKNFKSSKFIPFEKELKMLKVMAIVLALYCIAGNIGGELILANWRFQF